MIFKLYFYLPVLFATFFGAECNPAGCNCGCRPPPMPPPPSSSSSSSSSSSFPTVPLMLDNCGPHPCPLPPINAPPIQTCPLNKGVVALPACAPPPKTIANTCHCVKTVIKPQVVQQLITVPAIQRYIQTTHQPVVEHIHYQGIPINCPPYAPEEPAPSRSAPSHCGPPFTPCTAAASNSLTLPCFALASAKAALPAPPALHQSLLALLSLAIRPPPLATSSCLPLSSCTATSRPASAIIPANIPVPSCLLSLLSKPL